MKRVLAIATMATLAMTSDVSDMSETELNFLKGLGNGLKKAGKFVVEHPKIITTGAKILALDEQDDEFAYFTDRTKRKINADEQDDEFTFYVERPKKTAHADDNELFLGFGQKKPAPAPIETLTRKIDPSKDTRREFARFTREGAVENDDDNSLFLGLEKLFSSKKPVPPVETLTKKIDATKDTKREFARFNKEGAVENEDLGEELFALFDKIFGSKQTTKTAPVTQSLSRPIQATPEYKKGQIAFDHDNEFRHHKGTSFPTAAPEGESNEQSGPEVQQPEQPKAPEVNKNKGKISVPKRW